MEQVDWLSKKSVLLLNPRLPQPERKQLQILEEKFRRDAHIWVTSSGSSRKPNESLKLIALSKEAFLVSAKAVNQHLQVNRSDIWVQVLPEFHVGGLSIRARAFLSSCKVFQGLQNGKWNPEFFCQTVREQKATLASLVPAQLFDLVSADLKPPSSLRLIIIGGSKLDHWVHKKAIDLGWPVLQTYGMTECCSQVATTEINKAREFSVPKLKLLTHIEAKTNSDGQLMLKSKALLTGVAQVVDGDYEWSNPIHEGWYVTKDHARVEDGFLRFLGRNEDYIKVNGEGVNLDRLREILRDQTGHIALVGLPHERTGHEIILAYSAEVNEGVAHGIQDFFNAKVAPYERITRVLQVKTIPKTDLGKVDWYQLKNLLTLPKI